MSFDTFISIVRVLINDLGDIPTYDDERLQTVIVVAAHYVAQENDFDTDYSVDVSGEDITPSPLNDDRFINLTCLKAACLLDQGLYRTKALLAGVRAKCGPAELETNNVLKGFLDLLSAGPCKAYEDMKFQGSFGQLRNLKAVLSPFINKNFDPRGYYG